MSAVAPARTGGVTLRLSPLRWVATLVGVQFLCVIVWLLGPLAGPLEPAAVRAVLVMALILAWAAGNLGLDLLRSRREGALMRGIATADEASAVGRRLAEALAAMRARKGGRRASVYEQPWYAIIGPPGAGKTTALLNAGLRFPLAEAMGQGAVAGVGGTRLCDWWFTDRAVLIDTAGRYTTQDSSRDVDKAGWETFLALLRRTRPRQPLNGVIVAIALDDLASDRADLPAGHASAVRERIDELHARLGVRLPVYLLITKADLLAGFTEFFADLDRAGREQIWGTTFVLGARPDPAQALAGLQQRLDRRLLDRLDAEEAPDHRALIAGFPAQFASVRQGVVEFVERAFGPLGQPGAPLLRGLYFASGTQEGAPIDRLLGALSRAFGLSQRRVAPPRAEAGRAYFLAALLRDVVFREAMLVSERPGAARRRRTWRIAGFAGCLVLAFAGCAVLWQQARASAQRVAAEAAQVAAVAAKAGELNLDPVADADFAGIVPYLDAAAASVIPVGPEQADPAGFSQQAKLAAAQRVQYRHALERVLLPRLLWRVETVMRGSLRDPDALYEATRLDLMLGGQGPLDPPLAEEWLARDWESFYPGADLAPVREALRRHLRGLLAEPLPQMGLDGTLIAQSREIIGRVPAARRAWSRLKAEAAREGLAPWRPSQALGPAGLALFVRLSGRGLEEGVPGLYTVEGLRRAVLPRVAHASEQALGEGWVTGQEAEADPSRIQALAGEVMNLYANEYAAAWTAMLNDLDPAPMRTLTQAAQDLFILASPHSPLRSLLVSAVNELAPAAGNRDASALNLVDLRFAPLRAVFGTGGVAPLDAALRPLSDLQQQLAKQAATTVRSQAAASGEDPAQALRAEALRMPQPVQRWLVGLATGGAALRDGGPRGAMIAAWNAGGGPGGLCPQVIGGKFPFVPGAAQEASLEEVTRLLGPGGAIDAFFNAQLKPYVDMNARPWKLRQVDGVAAPLTQADLAQFQRAAALRDMLFQSDSATPLVRTEVSAGALDPGIAAASLELGGIAVQAKGASAPRPASITWPGRPSASVARLRIETAGEPLTIEEAGPWAAFRLVARGRVSYGGDKASLAFPAGERVARFDLKSSPNPWGSPLFAEFRCPAVQ